MTKEELIIDEKNFSEYFRDVRVSKPQRGDVMAKWIGRAEFIEGDMKKNIIDLLANKDKVFAAIQVMTKLGHATYKDAIKVCKEICNDLISGMTHEDVEKKAYSYDVEMFYYTKKENVPEDDPHWYVIGIKNLDQFIDSQNQKVTIKSNLIEDFKEQNFDIK
jgi:hypothetical protein